MPRHKLITFMLLLSGSLYAATTPKGDAQKGRALAEAQCAGCHGAEGNSPPAPNFPKLGGQHVEYILHEINEYREDHRISELMKPVIQGLSDADVLDIATWFASQEGVSAAVTRPDLLPLGKKIYLDGNSTSGIPSCDGCHEENGEGSARFPRIAGQNPEYTLEEFKRYINGQRKFGKKVMRTIAERLTEEEARAVAEYIATLK